MPGDSILALLALLFLWLLERIHRRSAADTEPDEGRRETEVEGWKDVEVIEGLPSRPLAFSATVNVSDADEDGASHTVNLAELSCTCPDFRQRRSGLPDDAIGRICAHVSQALQDTGVTSSFDDILQAIIRAGATRRVYYQATLRSGEKVAVGHDPGSEHVDVFTQPRPMDRKTGSATDSYRRYGYSLPNRRWLVDARPPGAVEIGDLIGSLPLER